MQRALLTATLLTLPIKRFEPRGAIKNFALRNVSLAEPTQPSSSLRPATRSSIWTSRSR